MGSEEKATRAASWIPDGLAWRRTHDIDDGPDERPGCKVLPGALVGGAGGLFEEAFVDGALDVDVHTGPILAGNHLDDALGARDRLVILEKILMDLGDLRGLFGGRT